VRKKNSPKNLGNKENPVAAGGLSEKFQKTIRKLFTLIAEKIIVQC
jgi:hypothetical protein